MTKKKKAKILSIDKKRAEKKQKRAEKKETADTADKKPPMNPAMVNFRRKLGAMKKSQIIDQVLAHAQMAGQERQKANKTLEDYTTLWKVALRNEQALSCANSRGFEWCRGCKHNPEGEGALGTFYGVDHDMCRECEWREEPPLPSQWETSVIIEDEEKSSPEPEKDGEA